MAIRESPKPCQVMVVPRALMGVKSVSCANSVCPLEYASVLVLNTYHFSGSFATYRCTFTRLRFYFWPGPIFCPYIWSAYRKSGPAPPGRFDVIMYGDRLEQVALMPRSGNQISKSILQPRSGNWIRDFGGKYVLGVDVD